MIVDQIEHQNFWWGSRKVVYSTIIGCFRWWSPIKTVASYWFMVFYVTFNNISVILWQSVLLVEETGVLWENHLPVVRHWQTLSHNVVSPEWDSNSQC